MRSSDSRPQEGRDGTLRPGDHDRRGYGEIPAFITVPPANPLLALRRLQSTQAPKCGALTNHRTPSRKQIPLNDRMEGIGAAERSIKCASAAFAFPCPRSLAAEVR